MKLITLLLLAFFLTACSTLTLPRKTVSGTLLVLPSDIRNSSVEGWARSYQLILSKYDHDEWVDLSRPIPELAKPYYILTDLTPGRYRINALGWRFNPGWRTAGGGKKSGEFVVAPVYFEMKSGLATVLSADIVIQQNDGGGGTASFWRIKELTEERAVEVATTIKKNNPGYWTIVN